MNQGLGLIRVTNGWSRRKERAFRIEEPIYTLMNTA
jgi:hypothetical protein